jgi:hypothetical protein
MQNDFLVINHGSIVVIRPLTDEAGQWLDDNAAAEAWQWLGSSLCVDLRYAAPLIAGIEADGFDVGHA